MRESDTGASDLESDASDLEDKSVPSPMPTARDWLRVAATAAAIVLICILWTFWA